MDDHTAPTFEMTFTNMPGGPCPKCGHCGNLVRHTGVYAPDGRRTIVHTDETGREHSCTLPTGSGFLDTTGGVWKWCRLPAVPERLAELERQRKNLLDYVATVGWSLDPDRIRDLLGGRP